MEVEGLKCVSMALVREPGRARGIVCMRVTEDRRPSALFPVNLPVGLQKYLQAVVLRLGRGFSVSAIINQLVPKYLDAYVATRAAGTLTVEREKALRRFEKTEPVVYDHRMPLEIAEQIRAQIPEAETREAFQAILDDLVLLAVFDFRENGPLKGREF
jgi:hypothetical protein